MEGGALLGDADAFALDVLERFYAAVVIVGGHQKCGRGITLLLAALIGNNAQLLAVGSHVIQAGGNAGRAHVYLGGGCRNSDGVRSIKPLRFNFNTLCGKKALVHGDKQRSAACQAQHAQAHLSFFLGRFLLRVVAATACGQQQKAQAQQQCKNFLHNNLSLLPKVSYEINATIVHYLT